MMVWKRVIPHKPEWHCNKSTWSKKSILCCVVVRFWPFFSRLWFFLPIKNDSGVITYRGSKNGHIRRNDVLVTTFDFFCRQTVAQSLLDIRASNHLTKRIQDNLGFWIPLRGFQIPGTGFQSVERGFWIPIVSGIRIPWAAFRIPKPRIPASTSKNFLDSGILIFDSKFHFLMTLTSMVFKFLKEGWGRIEYRIHNSKLEFT